MCRAALGLQAEQLIFHCVRPPECSGSSTPATGNPVPLGGALLHISLLAAKRCITKLWLSNTTPSIQMVLAQLRAYLHMDRLFIEHNPKSVAKGFFKKWKYFIVQHMSQSEIEQLMLSFKDTKWYHTSQLAGSLGRLEVSTDLC